MAILLAGLFDGRGLCSKGTSGSHASGELNSRLLGVMIGVKVCPRTSSGSPGTMPGADCGGPVSSGSPGAMPGADCGADCGGVKG